MISEAELGRLAALISECSKPHCGNGPRNSLTSALHQCAPALIPELQRLRRALDAIAGGHTERLIGAPDPMTAVSPQAFQAGMWLASQETARVALAATEDK